MKAVIMAGGKGLRLRPFTTVLPKPLMPVGELPILEILLRQLARAGVDEAIISIGYLGPLIRSYLDHSAISKRVRIRYHTEQEPLGTAGAVGSIEGLDAPFFVLNGDILTTMDFAAMYRSHLETQAELTVGVVHHRTRIELGVLDLTEEGRVAGYDEKPTHIYAASMGVYVYSPSVQQFIPPGKYLDAPTLVLKLIEQNRKVQAYTPDALWLDLGNQGELERAQTIFSENLTRFLPDGV
ncbi:NTP transferase domain-containing protein [Roseomonas sp. HJA6]|uniref:NTP transferase domain-containing protein n=1 Tax=Roseomonas alba TaxID=2846776 RepID=A0ABS7A2F5_9PROT|nr:sugar phosphate nucleotidyltransferase [Neoroseomonas alba]MBW6396476.1 NTP transferase domain-containing protein [Neoroseomonas alba]